MEPNEKPTEPKPEATNLSTPAGAINAETPPDGGTGPDPVPYARFKEVNDKLNALVAKSEQADAEAEKARIAKLESDGELQGLIDELKPKAERAKTLEGVVKVLLKAKLAAVPEDMQDMIPEGAPESQLAWLGKAEAKGLFAKPPGPNTHAGAGLGTSGDRVAAQAEHDALRKEVWESIGIRVNPDDSKT